MNTNHWITRQYSYAFWKFLFIHFQLNCLKTKVKPFRLNEIEVDFAATEKSDLLSYCILL